MHSAPEFYALLGLNKDKCFLAISALLDVKGTDLYDCQVFVKNGLVLGIFAGIEGSQVDACQLISTICLLQQLNIDDHIIFRNRLKKLSRGVHPTSSENRALITASHYLLRISVARTHRRCGVGSVLLREFMASAGSNTKLSLQVKSNNLTAIRFYLQHGFTTLDSTDHDYLMMIADV